MPRFDRSELVARFRDMARQREPIVGGGAGTGLSARCEEAGGIDLIVIYASGRYRMAGRGSLAGLLAHGNANEIVLEIASEVLPVVQRAPVRRRQRHRPVPDPRPFLRRLKGQPFHDPDADAALFEALEASVRQTPHRRLLRLPHNVNDPEFAAALVQNFREVAG